ncbi:MAG: hypothetical protein WBC44_14720 [Planctomycetaceae bacterium]
MSHERHPPVSNKSLFGLLVMLTSWQVTLLALLIERGRIPSLVFAAAGLAATIFVVAGGRKAATPYWRYSGRITLTPGQSVLVTIYILALGGLGAWALVLKLGTA